MAVKLPRSPPCAADIGCVGFALATVAHLTDGYSMLTQITARRATPIRVSAFAAVSLLFTIGLAACSEDESPTEPTSTDPGTTTPTLAPEAIADPEDAAIAAYTRYWTTLMQSFAAPDGDFTEFAAIAAGEALEQAQATEEGWIADGVHGGGAIVHHVTVKDSLLTDEVQQVVLTDCADTTGTQVLDGDGNPVEDEKYGYREIQSRVELLDGFWVVTAMAVQEIGSCVPNDDS